LEEWFRGVDGRTTGNGHACQIHHDHLHDSVDFMLRVDKDTAEMLWSGMVHGSNVDANAVGEEGENASHLRIIVARGLDGTEERDHGPTE